MIFGCIDFIWSIITVSAAGRNYWTANVYVCSDEFRRLYPPSTYSYDYCDAGFKRGLK